MWVQIDRWKCISDIPEKRILLHFHASNGTFPHFFQQRGLDAWLTPRIPNMVDPSVSVKERGVSPDMQKVSSTTQ